MKIYHQNILLILIFPISFIFIPNMFNLQVTLSDFQSRKRQFELSQQFVLLLRFANIKIDIRISLNADQLIGGKRIVLDLSTEELKNMFANYPLGMFIQNKSGKFFCLLSLQKLEPSDIISGQQVYFYNDDEEMIYSASLSIVFTEFKNPRMPNKEVIQNQKTFNEIFKKPAVPTHTVGAKTLSSFLYGKKKQQSEKSKSKTTNGRTNKHTSAKAQKNTLTKTNQQTTKKSNVTSQFIATSLPENICIYKPFDEDQNQHQNPPVMQFTNTASDPIKGPNLLKAQMAELNLTAPESIKLMTAYDSKNAFMKTKPKEGRETIIKIQERLQSHQLTKTLQKKRDSQQIKVDREELRNKAKKQMSAYQGNNSIKIPLVKNGKYELIQLAHLTQQEIANFAAKQKQLEFQEQQKKLIEKELQRKQKENNELKKKLEEKQRLLTRQQEAAKRQKLQLLKAKQLADEAKREPPNKSERQSSFDSEPESHSEENEDEESEQMAQKQEEEKQVTEQQNYYESDFEQISMASVQKKSRVSANSQKKQDSENYYDSYDPDFQSFSQSMLGSQPRLSMSGLSDSFRSNSPKRR